MTVSVGKTCLYCSRPLTAEDRVVVCDRCYAVHHEECWNRNGRCSTFRCAGLPRTMVGSDVPEVLRTAMARENDQPRICPFCASTVYIGAIRSRMRSYAATGPYAQRKPAQVTGLLFVGKGRPNPHHDWFGKNFLAKMLGGRSWILAGAEIRARSCGKCRKLFLWGQVVDEAFTQRAVADPDTRICPHCATSLYQGSIALDASGPAAARFECDTVPDFHSDWFGHNILDRYFLNRWSPTVQALPAFSCPECCYTEIAARPIYRFP